MKPFRWGTGKNKQLMQERAISFEQMVIAMEGGGLLDILQHPNADKYPYQKDLVVNCDGYAYLLPFVEEEDHYFLKTAVPSGKAKRVNIRLSSGDLRDIRVKALEEGLPYQTLIASVLHKYVTGRLAERNGA